jgi:heterogeneous nuclear ribonucleoprotein U-like protein 1
VCGYKCIFHNYKFNIHVMQEEPFFPVEEGFVFIDNIPLEDRVRGQLPPTKKEECEVGSFQDFTIEI